ncbi:DUF1413 domain-containing protein [Puniceibacterium antarcticum]|nr:DUF1413 domain-containing protein [Puniceibacterium antarcticum]
MTDRQDILLSKYRKHIEDSIWRIGTGKAFVLEDLFCPQAWAEMSDTDHQVLGKAFYASIRKEPFENVCPTDYPVNPQEYVRFEPRGRT